MVGGGLAGLTSSIHLAKNGIYTILIEKQEYPFHKVCGEYVSNEVLYYIRSLGLDPFVEGAVAIDKFTLVSVSGKTVLTDLPLGGFGISRYTLDESLSKLAEDNGVQIIHDTVFDIDFIDDQFIVTTKKYGTLSAKLVIGAYGKRNALDVKLNRKFIKKKSPFVAVKAHFEGKYIKNLVGLYNFPGGYCGVSNIENDRLNLCYIVNFKEFKKHDGIEDFQHNIVFKNQELKKIFLKSRMVFEKPITISQISFTSKTQVQNHVLMCGDTAGLIHPLCGNGMSMAIHSGKILGNLGARFFKDVNYTRNDLEQEYQEIWNKSFGRRLRVGRIVAYLLENRFTSEISFSILKIFPQILPKIISKTHGKMLSEFKSI